MDHPQDGAWGPHIPWKEDRPSGSGNQNQNVDNQDVNNYDWESVWSTYSALDIDADADATSQPQGRVFRRLGQMPSPTSSESTRSSFDRAGAGSRDTGTSTSNPRIRSRLARLEENYSPSPVNFSSSNSRIRTSGLGNQHEQSARRNPPESPRSFSGTTRAHRLPEPSTAASAGVRCEDTEIEDQIEAVVLREYGCAVCLDTLSKTHLLNCGHKFCQFCIVEWRRRSSSQVCPICREIIVDAKPDFETDQQIKKLYFSLSERIQTRRTAFEVERESALSQQKKIPHFDPNPADLRFNPSTDMAVAELEAQLREAFYDIQDGMRSESDAAGGAPNGHQSPIREMSYWWDSIAEYRAQVARTRREELLREAALLRRAPDVSGDAGVSSSSIAWDESRAAGLNTTESSLMTSSSSPLGTQPFEVPASWSSGVLPTTVSERKSTFRKIVNTKRVPADEEQSLTPRTEESGHARGEQSMSSRDEVATAHSHSLLGRRTYAQIQPSSVTTLPITTRYINPAHLQSFNVLSREPTPLSRCSGNGNTRNNLSESYPLASTANNESTSQFGYGYGSGMSSMPSKSNSTQDQLQTGAIHGSQQRWYYEPEGVQSAPLPPEYAYGRRSTGYYTYEPSFPCGNQLLQPSLSVVGSSQPGGVVQPSHAPYLGPQPQAYINGTSGQFSPFQMSTLIPMQAMNQQSSPFLPTNRIPAAAAPPELDSYRTTQTWGHANGKDCCTQTMTEEMSSYVPISRAYLRSTNQANTHPVHCHPRSSDGAAPQADGILSSQRSRAELLSQAAPAPPVSNSRPSHGRNLTGIIEMDPTGVNSNCINYSFSIQENQYGHNNNLTWPNQLHPSTVEVFPLAEQPNAKLVVVKFIVSN